MAWDPGIFERLHDWLFGRSVSDNILKKCSCSICQSLEDPRCVGRNCTYHCHINCGDRCLNIWYKNQSGDRDDDGGGGGGDCEDPEDPDDVLFLSNLLLKDYKKASVDSE